MAPQMPNAVPRSRPWNSCESSASDVANMIAPPIPCAAAREDQEQRIVGEPAERRGEREQRRSRSRRRACRPNRSATDPGRQDARRERERVGVDHPLQLGERRVQRPLDRGQRDVHDRDVEQQHEDRDADRDQRPPLAVHGGDDRGARPRGGSRPGLARAGTWGRISDRASAAAWAFEGGNAQLPGTAGGAAATARESCLRRHVARSSRPARRPGAFSGAYRLVQRAPAPSSDKPPTNPRPPNPPKGARAPLVLTLDDKV